MTTPNVDHWIIVMEGVPPGFINTTSSVLGLGKKTAEWLGLTIVGEHAHYFGPGVSALVIISESHLSFHTWPEHNGWVYADIASCASNLEQEQVEEAYRALFSPSSIIVRRAVPPDH